MDWDSIFVCALILAAAFIFLGFIMSPRDQGPATTKIATMQLEPTTDDPASMVTLKGQPDGTVVITRRNLPLREGETVNLVITIFNDHVKIVEKKGYGTMGAEGLYNGESRVSCIGQRWYGYRYESEVTGQWCTFEFTNVAGNEKQASLRL